MSTIYKPFQQPPEFTYSSVTGVSSVTNIVNTRAVTIAASLEEVFDVFRNPEKYRHVSKNQPGGYLTVLDHGDLVHFVFKHEESGLVVSSQGRVATVVKFPREEPVSYGKAIGVGEAVSNIGWGDITTSGTSPAWEDKSYAVTNMESLFKSGPMGWYNITLVQPELNITVTEEDHAHGYARDRIGEFR